VVQGDRAAHGDRITAQRGVEIVDISRVHVYNEIFSTDDEQVARSTRCLPITLAWSERMHVADASYGPIARERLPQATFKFFLTLA